MVMNKKASKIQTFFLLQIIFSLLRFVGKLFAKTVFVIILFAVSLISSHVITEPSLMLFTYITFSQLHAAGFQT